MNGILAALSLSLSILTTAVHAAVEAPGSPLESKSWASANFLQNKLRKPGRPPRDSGNIAAVSRSPGEFTAIQTQSGFRYRYIALDPLIPPEFILFAPAKILDSKRVFGTAYACDAFCIPSIAAYHQGAIKILHQNALAYDANQNGTIGGSVVLDNASFIEQAALFDNGGIKLIPRVQGEVSSHVVRITDSGWALVKSAGASNTSYYLYKNQQAMKLDFGTDNIDFLEINNEGIISGTIVEMAGRAFRFNPFAGKLTLLNPLATEPSSWGMGINNQNAVLGYSFIGGALERVGVWKDEQFSTYFVEGTSQFPTISNRLLWNKHGLIVITFPSNDTTSYLLPKPGIRLNLAELVDGLPSGANLSLITGINDRGDLIGLDPNGGTFLLERVPINAETLP